MTDLHKAAQQALEALELASSCVDAYYIPKGKMYLPDVEAAITALREALAKPAVPPGYALVPVDALKWLHGEEGVFECPPEGYFRGHPKPYWWRTVFSKMCAAAPQPKDKP